jgi:PTH2 family peptidyl-tRNA hydrolase
MENVKQILVVRTKYPDNNGGFRKLRTGKLIAQACHASMAFISNLIRENNISNLTEEQKYWLNNSFTKICVYVETEEELLEVYKNAQEAQLTSYLITDNGYTEFNNIPTNTVVGIGPHAEDKLKPITGHLPLL